MEPLPSEDDIAEPPSLRFLRILVTVLTAVMIGGVLVIIALLVIRSPQSSAPPLPDQITLPDGAVPFSVTYGPDMLLVLSEDKRLFVFDPKGETLRHTIPID